jgi:LacI family transcriptional regulator
MACNDDCAERVIEACKLASLSVPDQIAVLGADNDELVCDLSDPPLSSVAINFERAGYESAAILDRLLRRERVAPKRILVQATHVVARRSTDIVAVEDPHLAVALRFIRDRVRQPVAVLDVARAAGLSRRSLEQRFRHILRRSALHEIRRVRVEQIQRMLVETNQSVDEIAHSMGFAGSEHIARYFKTETTMTPKVFRRRFGRR